MARRFDWKRITREVFPKTIGPTPWSRNNLPTPSGCVWAEDGRWTVLTRDDQALLAVPMYVWVFFAQGTVVGYWFRDKAGFEIELVDLSEHRPIEVDPELRSSRPIHDSKTVSLVCVALLPNGIHCVPAITEPGMPNEVFLLGKHVKSDEDKMAEDAIYVYEPAVGRVSVFPQVWFTDKFDLGYQWITNLGRDPVTGRIVGGGFRISPFVLDESNTRVEEFRDKPISKNFW